MRGGSAGEAWRLRTHVTVLVAVALLPTTALMAYALAAQRRAAGSAAAGGLQDVVFLQTLSLLLVVATVAFGVAWAASERFLVAPTRRLVDATRRMAAGDLAARSGVAEGPLELRELARSFDEMAASLQRQTEDLREVDRIKTHILNSAAHELNTPITPIKLQVRVLAATRGLDERQQKAVGVMSRNVDRLALLVQDMLDVARIQNGRLAVAPRDVDLHETLLEAHASFEEPARAAGVDLRLESEPGLRSRADPNRVMQAVLSLVGNALKFTSPGGTVVLRGVAMRDEVLVEVEDDGAGIARDRLDRLFRPFSHAHDAMEDPRPGAGLGLYISKGIVEEHGGRVWVRSDGPGKGATVGFALPALVPTAGGAPPERPLPHAEPGGRVARTG